MLLQYKKMEDYILIVRRPCTVSSAYFVVRALQTPTIISIPHRYHAPWLLYTGLQLLRSCIFRLPVRVFIGAAVRRCSCILASPIYSVDSIHIAIRCGFGVNTELRRRRMSVVG
jgi:hypothetical protein